MGNIISYADSKYAPPQEDTKWLMMRAIEYFQTSLNEDYSKLPEFKGTERASLRSLRDVGKSTERKGSNQATVNLSDSLYNLNHLSPEALATVLSLRSRAEDYITSITHEKGSKKYKLSSRHLNDMRNLSYSTTEVLELATQSMGAEEYMLSLNTTRCVRSRAIFRLHLAIARQLHLTSADDVIPNKTGNSSGAETDHEKGTNSNGLSIFAGRKPTRIASLSPHETAALASAELMFATNLSLMLSVFRSFIEDGNVADVRQERLLRDAFTQLLSSYVSGLHEIPTLPRADIDVTKHSTNNEIEESSIPGNGAENADELDAVGYVVCTFDGEDCDTQLSYGPNRRSASKVFDDDTPRAAVACIRASDCTASMTVTIGGNADHEANLSVGFSCNSFPQNGMHFGAVEGSCGLVADSTGDTDTSSKSVLRSKSTTNDSTAPAEAQWRGLVVGDTITVVCNLEAKWVEIFLNLSEERHRFDVTDLVQSYDTGPNSGNEFCLGVVLGSSHTLTLVRATYNNLKHAETIFGESREISPEDFNRTCLFPPPFVCEQCDEDFTTSLCIGLPSAYPQNSIVTCDVCSRHDIQEDKFWTFSCIKCNYDMCFGCGMSRRALDDHEDSIWEEEEEEEEEPIESNDEGSPLSNTRSRNDNCIGIRKAMAIYWLSEHSRQIPDKFRNLSGSGAVKILGQNRSTSLVSIQENHPRVSPYALVMREGGLIWGSLQELLDLCRKQIGGSKSAKRAQHRSAISHSHVMTHLHSNKV